MTDLRDQLVKLDADLGRTWAKIEILLGLLAASAGQFLGIWQLTGAKGELNFLLVLAGMALIVFGGYLTLAGHRSHLYRWNNRNTVTLIDEIRRLQRGE
ncbi:MAG TPA: hypothetical protein VE988_22875 [Gemmataceae bacterium]|nr:hypothetical protein [Gemmataceae bacterium]